MRIRFVDDDAGMLAEVVYRPSELPEEVVPDLHREISEGFCDTPLHDGALRPIGRGKKVVLMTAVLPVGTEDRVVFARFSGIITRFFKRLRREMRRLRRKEEKQRVRSQRAERRIERESLKKDRLEHQVRPRSHPMVTT